MRLIEVSPMSRPPYLLVALLSFEIIASLPATARAADPREEQLAQALFEEGRGLMDRKRYAEACAKLKESQRLDPGGGTLLNLAICHEKEGKLATAKADYEEALAIATRDARKDRLAIARTRLAALEPTVPRISVSVGSGADVPGLELRLDGLVLRRAAWGVAAPVDPGAHRIEASAPGRAGWSMPITLQPSQKKSVEVPALGPLTELPGGAFAGGGVAGATPGAASSAELGGLGMTTPAPAREAEPPMIVEEGSPPPRDARVLGRIEPARSNPLFYGALGLTLVGATTSAITGVVAYGAREDAKSGCVPDRSYCRDQASTNAADRATTMAWVSTVSLGVAVVGVIGMLALPRRTGHERAALTSPVPATTPSPALAPAPLSPPPAVLSPSPSLGASLVPGGARISLSGTF
jgi:hypothetical protein